MADRQRLFFALWPDEPLRAQIAEVQHVLGQSPGRPVAVENFHITLVFLGSVEQALKDCVCSQAAALQVPAFELRLDSLGYWRKPQVLWIGARQVPTALAHLAEGLQRGAALCGLDVDERPFQAHMTLWRKVRRRPPGWASEGLALPWRVEHFALVESVAGETGVSYHCLHTWPLQRE